MADKASFYVPGRFLNSNQGGDITTLPDFGPSYGSVMYTKTNIEVVATLDCPQLCILRHVIHRHNTKNHCYCAKCRRGASVAGDGSANTVRRRRRIGSLVFCLGYLLRHVMGRELSHPDLRLHHRLLQRQVVESLCSVLAQDRHCAIINYVWCVGS